MTTFTAAIVREINARFEPGAHFTKHDLVKVGNSFGKNDRSIVYVLRELEKRGGLNIVGEMPVKRAGTQPSKIYALVSSAKLVGCSKYSKFSNEEWKREMKRKEDYANQCG